MTTKREKKKQIEAVVILLVPSSLWLTCQHIKKITCIVVCLGETTKRHLEHLVSVCRETIPCIWLLGTKETATRHVNCCRVPTTIPKLSPLMQMPIPLKNINPTNRKNKFK